MKVKLAFCMGKTLRVKWLKTGVFARHIPVLLTIGSASPGVVGRGVWGSRGTYIIGIPLHDL